MIDKDITTEKTEVSLNQDTSKYLDLFYSPELSAYSFLKNFFARLFIKNVTQITRDLSEFIYQMKRTTQYGSILVDFSFRDNGFFKYSAELEDGILTLQNMGLLGKKNPSFGIILIEMDNNIANQSFERLSSEHQKLIEEIAQKYIDEQMK